MTTTYQNDDSFFTLVKPRGFDHPTPYRLINEWFNNVPVARYRYIIDDEILESNFTMAKVHQLYPGVAIITFVRNPWANAVDGYEKIKHYPDVAAMFGMRIDTFGDFLKSLKDIDPALYLQSSWCQYTDSNGVTHKARYILREENTAEDFKAIQEYFESNTPLETTQYVPLDYRSYYTPELRALADEIFKKDIDLLGYTF